MIANIARRQLTIADLAFLLAVAVTLAVMSDVGSGFNHLLDVVVLVPSSSPELGRISVMVA